ncbi:D-alanine--D-alanine ligase [Sansalvadorimonas sp. 2012CJ34-2]|uniref:D-alanine--D-alanine ligase n=1 Tax=Parendozoicomonas callyspongiae TaxID=2942213 RepID=A0ABT0PC56_9GAMM|nr:D-alanine--D-alanine ligase [Sansalvadorimonas sp. 2012CJ34-2]MCL6268968.1 D-alanine--D-alanine ligase [Sansalvadorimonas sp. 2012CJ34-2]
MTEQTQKDNLTKSTEAFGRVAVLCGGDSPERQVSLKSGGRIFKALQDRGVDVVMVDAATDLVDQLQTIKPDRVFLALHGASGEDGTVQGLLDFLKIPYTGSGVKGSAIAMDKSRSKLIWKSIDLQTPDFQIVDAATDLDAVELPVPCFVKPNSDGSSIATFPVYSRDDLKPAIEKVLAHADKVLVEQMIEGPEFTVSILNGRPLPGIRLETDNTFYDYEAKYLSDSTRYLLPCGLTEEKEQELQELALKAFDSIGCAGWGRVDVMQDGQGNFWLLEVNTIPGMTDHSLVPMAAKAVGYDFEDLVLELLQATGQEERPWTPAGTSTVTARAN